jgi:hypothetical protein
MYTTQGYMTPDDIADHEALTDTGPHLDCPGHPDDLDEGSPFPLYCSRAEDCPGDDLAPTLSERLDELHAEAIREDWARRQVVAAGKSWETHVAKFSGAVLPR